jgi:hypothetical protein
MNRFYSVLQQILTGGQKFVKKCALTEDKPYLKGGEQEIEPQHVGAQGKTRKK